VELLRQRDADAINQLVRKESGLVFRCIRRLVHDDDEAQSLVQETFLQALTKLDSFRGDSKFSTWLCAIAINLARGALRKRARYDLLEEQDIDRLQPTFTAGGRHTERYTDWNPESEMEKQEMQTLLHNAIDRLPESYRTVVILRDIQEIPSDEVAQILNISEGAMRVRLHRARQTLRTLLDDQILD
jgi:RNA polymerase sigma-70 factor (ECF subfamily)